GATYLSILLYQTRRRAVPPPNAGVQAPARRICLKRAGRARTPTIPAQEAVLFKGNPTGFVTFIESLPGRPDDGDIGNRCQPSRGGGGLQFPGRGSFPGQIEVGAAGASGGNFKRQLGLIVEAGG